MADLIHGGDLYGLKEKGIVGAIDFSVNINPLGMPEGVKRTILECIDSCSAYPDPLSRELTAAICNCEGVQKDHVMCGNGAADLIFRLVLGKKPKKAIVMAPTFAEYEKALEVVGCEVDKYYLRKEKNFALGEDFLEMIDHDIDMIFLCNPNNPTGQLVSKAFLEKILKISIEKSVFVVIDQCFLDFVEEPERYSMVSHAEETSSILILKAFTKSYAMAGLRLGYCICSDVAFLEKMRAMGQPWPVSAVAQLAGVQALKEEEYIKISMEIICRERKYLCSELTALGISIYEPSANYIFFKIEEISTFEENKDFIDGLLRVGIIIRDCSNYQGLSYGYYRICIKDHVSNLKLLDGIRQGLNY